MIYFTIILFVEVHLLVIITWNRLFFYALYDLMINDCVDVYVYVFLVCLFV